MVDPNLFGAPRTGSHSTRILDTAVVDFVATAALAYIIPLASSYFYSLLAWLVVGEIVHFVVGVRTSWQQYLGLQ